MLSQGASNAALFSPDYATARQRFRDAARLLDCGIYSYPISNSRGPHGEDLTIDVAVTQGSSTGGTLVLSSGIHGVEGFFGSAVQIGVIEQWRTLPQSDSIRCVLIHALNPYGFAWRRRCDEHNVDLNRNLLVQDEWFSGSPAGYAGLDHLLNPKRGPSRWEPVSAKFLLAIARRGMPALKQAIAGGQYEFPQGLFYGGAGPSRMTEILSAHFDDWLDGASRVVHIDFHTGLGASAACRLLVDYALTPAQRDRMSAWFGPASFEALRADGLAYEVRGSLGRWCVARYPRVDYLYAGAEFGTYRPTAIIAGLRAENQSHHWCRLGDLLVEQTKERLVELFCPRSTTWRTLALERAAKLVTQAVNGLAGVPSGEKHQLAGA